MGIQETEFCSVDWTTAVTGCSASQCAFDIYVSQGFSDVEVAAILSVIQTANDLLGGPVLTWRCISDTPGFVRGKTGMIIEAAPQDAQNTSPHTMVVVGGSKHQRPIWMRQVRALQHKMLPVVLLSEAATLYIQNTRPAGRVTTHWRDVAQLEETGHYPNLTTRLSERSNGVITAAGGSSTTELMIGMISSFLTAEQVAEMGNRLLLGNIRKSHAEQPKDIAQNTCLFDPQIVQVLRIMEDNVSDPLPMSILARQVGISTRQLERVFRAALKETPARFYKRLRAKRARVMIEETLLPLIDVAVATGFGSNGTLSKALKDEYGMTASKMRARKSVDLLAFQ